MAWTGVLRPDAARPAQAAWVVGAVAAPLAVGFALAHQPWLTAGVVVGGTLLLVTMLRPLTVIGLMLFLGPLDLSFLTGGFKALLPGLGGLDMNGIRLVGMVASLAAVAVVDRRVLPHAFGRYGRWYLVFLAYAAATLFASASPVDGLRLLLKLAYPFIIFVMVLAVAESREDLTRLMWWALAGAVVVVLVNPIYAMAGGYYVEPSGRIRFQGMGAHQNPFSFYLLIMLLAAFTRFTVRGQYRYLFLCLGLGTWIVLTLTRITFGAVVFGLAGLALYDAAARRRYRTLLLAAAAGAVIAVPLLPLVLERSFGYVPSPAELLGLLSDPVRLYRSVNWQGREALWAVVYQAFRTNPVIGLGLGSSTAVLLSSFPAGWGATVAHNEYLRLAAETGLIGVGLYLVAIAQWGRATLTARQPGDPLAFEFALPAFAGILAWAVIAATDNAFDYYAAFTQYIGFFCAATLAMQRFVSPGPAGGEGGEDAIDH